METDLLIGRIIVIVFLIIGLFIMYITYGWFGMAVYYNSLFWAAIGC